MVAPASAVPFGSMPYLNPTSRSQKGVGDTTNPPGTNASSSRECLFRVPLEPGIGDKLKIVLYQYDLKGGRSVPDVLTLMPVVLMADISPIEMERYMLRLADEVPRRGSR